MRSDRELEALSDIASNIKLAREFISDLDYPAFQADRKTIYAVVRCLEIISEASRRLTPGLKERHPGIRWRDIAGAGNIYRHNYNDVLSRAVWNTVHEALGDLDDMVRAELER